MFCIVKEAYLLKLLFKLYRLLMILQHSVRETFGYCEMMLKIIRQLI